MVVQWLALFPHSKRVLGLNPPADWGPSVWNLHVLLVPAWVFSSVWVWVVVFLYMLALWLTGNLTQVYPASRPMPAGISSSTPATLLRISSIDNGWMDGCFIWWFTDSRVISDVWLDQFIFIFICIHHFLFSFQLKLFSVWIIKNLRMQSYGLVTLLMRSVQQLPFKVKSVQINLFPWVIYSLSFRWLFLLYWSMCVF